MDKETKLQIANRIKEAREWKGLTQVGLAERLKVARQTYLDLETGKTEPKARLLMEIAEITERPVTWLLYGDDGIEPIVHEYQDEIDTLLMHFTKLPHSARSMLLKQCIQLAKYLVEYTKCLSEIKNRR